MGEISKHLITFGLTFLLWLGFLLVGKSTYYYQKVPYRKMLWFCLASVIGMGFVIYFGLLWIWRGDYLISSAWCAFYATVPLFVYDYLYLGIYKKQGLSFLKTHWYLTLFYIILWPEFLFVGWLMT